MADASSARLMKIGASAAFNCHGLATLRSQWRNSLQWRIVADFPFGIDARLFQAELTFEFDGALLILPSCNSQQIYSRSPAINSALRSAAAAVASSSSPSFWQNSSIFVTSMQDR